MKFGADARRKLFAVDFGMTFQPDKELLIVSLLGTTNGEAVNISTCRIVARSSHSALHRISWYLRANSANFSCESFSSYLLQKISASVKVKAEPVEENGLRTGAVWKSGATQEDMALMLGCESDPFLLSKSLYEIWRASVWRLRMRCNSPCSGCALKRSISECNFVCKFYKPHRL